jgi:hypothetical protein
MVERARGALAILEAEAPVVDGAVGQQRATWYTTPSLCSTTLLQSRLTQELPLCDWVHGAVVIVATLDVGVVRDAMTLALDPSSRGASISLREGAQNARRGDLGGMVAVRDSYADLNGREMDS